MHDTKTTPWAIALLIAGVALVAALPSYGSPVAHGHGHTAHACRGQRTRRHHRRPQARHSSYRMRSLRPSISYPGIDHDPLSVTTDFPTSPVSLLKIARSQVVRFSRAAVQVPITVTVVVNQPYSSDSDYNTPALIHLEPYVLVLNNGHKIAFKAATSRLVEIDHNDQPVGQVQGYTATFNITVKKSVFEGDQPNRRKIYLVAYKVANPGDQTPSDDEICINTLTALAP